MERERREERGGRGGEGVSESECGGRGREGGRGWEEDIYTGGEGRVIKEGQDTSTGLSVRSIYRVRGSRVSARVGGCSP